MERSPWADLAKQVTQHRRLSEAERESKRRDGQSTHFFADQLKSCKSLAEGRRIHAQILETKHYRNLFLANLVIEMYGKRGSLDEAWAVFSNLREPNIFSWNILLAATLRVGEIDQARRIFDRMPERDAVSWNEMIAAYAQIGHIAAAKLLFDAMPAKNSYSWNSLILAYAHAGHAIAARDLLFAMPRWDPISWTTVIAAFASAGDTREAVTIFRIMDLEGVPADLVTITAVLDACASHSALGDGAAIHSSILDAGFAIGAVVLTGLVNMYGKSGRLDQARAIFDAIAFRERDLVAWTSLIAGYAQWGHGHDAIRAFQAMIADGILPDSIVFISVLCACSHAGRLDLALELFQSVSSDYSVARTVHHCACLIDLLGKAGWLDEAEILLELMPFEPDSACWTALLAACKLHKDEDRAERASARAISLDPASAAPYALMAKIQRSDEVATAVRLDRGVRKLRATSSITVRGRVHEFVAGDLDHPRAVEIYAELDRLRGQLEAAGYVPDTAEVTQDADELEKESIVFAHSEKLAVGFGLLATPPNSPLRVVNNLRMCSDCHSAMKSIAEITQREIVVRDLIRFHRFDEQGRCSCGDYW